MALLNNAVTLRLSRSIFAAATRSHILGRDRVPQDNKFVLAATHLSHYDPFVISVLMLRKIDWMARAEFYESPFSKWMVRQADGFRIDRYGFALPGIRESFRRIQDGRVVGIFPEGELRWGEGAAVNGAPIKAGTGLISRRSELPVVPCVMLGSRQFSRVVPWLPLRMGRLYLGFGHPIYPDLSLPPGRESRQQITQQIHQAFQEVYQELSSTYTISGEALP